MSLLGLPLHATELPAGATFLNTAVWPIQRKDLKLTSSASCASTSCHGGPLPSIANPYSSHGAEYPLWMATDPHAQSWRTLCSDSGLSIMKRLNIIRNTQIVDQAAYDNCLACHNTTLRFDEPRSVEFHAEGVGCASCHGPAELWRGTHFQPASDSPSQRIGMIDNRNLLIRARMCAACHVGDRDRDMNHDMIAAGHPALRYELATYHAKLPKHWRDPQREHPGFEAELWISGQIAGLDAELSLLEARAEKRLSISQWPELAASNCSACHQNLRITPTDEAISSTGDSTRFSASQTFGVLQLLRQRMQSDEAGNADAQLLSSLMNLRMAMHQSAVPDRVQVAQAAAKARMDLDAWLCSDDGRAQLESFSADRLLQLVVSMSEASEATSYWESSSQFYLAAVASRAAWAGSGLNQTLDTARELRQALLFDADSSLLVNADVPQRNIPGKIENLATALRALAEQSKPSVAPKLPR